MSLLSWVFQTQSHKTKDGYYLNHDSLILASPEERKRLIFYFIANQVPEKLEPNDRVEYQRQKRASVDLHENILTYSAVAAYLLRAPMFRSRYFPKIALNAGFHFAASVLVFYFTNTLAHSLFEPRFVAESPLITELSKKYDFTVFDFAQAKKEAHLKHFRAELIRDAKIEVCP